MKFENMVLTGARVRILMRKHGVTMRGIKDKHQITLKRTREVRESGVRGFSAAEWFWIITGRWPDEPVPPTVVGAGHTAQKAIAPQHARRNAGQHQG